MVFKGGILLLAVVAAAGCSDFPKDPERTLERVRAEGAFRVGIVAPGADLPDLGKQRLLLARVAERTGARPDLAIGASEDLLRRLEEGEIDLVVGEFHADSPWRRRVTILPPLEPAKSDSGRAALAAVARNGENGWIALLYREGWAIGGSGS